MSTEEENKVDFLPFWVESLFPRTSNDTAWEPVAHALVSHLKTYIDTAELQESELGEIVVRVGGFAVTHGGVQEGVQGPSGRTFEVEEDFVAEGMPALAKAFDIAKASITKKMVEAAIDGRPDPYEGILKDERVIASHIDGLTPKGVDVEFVEEYFWGSGAILGRAHVNALQEGNPEGNVMVKSRQNKYNKMSADTSPPVVLEGLTISDGNHRLRSAQHRKDITIAAYFVVDESIELKPQLQRKTAPAP